MADVAFEVESIDWPCDDRVEISGRWFGVRGRRFVRPTLEAEVDGEQRRMLAMLDHKPWAAEDGEDWVAAFAWDGEHAAIEGAELTVAPDLSVELLTDGPEQEERPQRARRSRASVLEAELADARRKTERLARKLRRADESYLADIARRDREHAEELERLRAELATSRADAERGVQELSAKLHSERERLRSKLDSERERLRRERDSERQRVESLGGELQQLRDELASVRDAAAAEAERLTAELEASRRESASARADREAAARERDTARRERDAAVAAARGDAPARSAQLSSSDPAPGSRVDETEPTVALPVEPAPDASRLRRVRPGLYRWEAPGGGGSTAERALAFAALALAFLIFVLLVL